MKPRFRSRSQRGPLLFLRFKRDQIWQSLRQILEWDISWSIKCNEYHIIYIYMYIIIYWHYITSVCAYHLIIHVHGVVSCCFLAIKDSHSPEGTEATARQIQRIVRYHCTGNASNDFCAPHLVSRQGPDAVRFFSVVHSMAVQTAISFLLGAMSMACFGQR